MDRFSLQQFNEGLSALKNVVDLATSFLNLRDKPKAKEEADKLEEALIQSRSYLFQMHDIYAALLQKKAELEEKVAQLEAWGEDKENYKLSELATGVLAFAYAPQGQATQPPHWLCDQCYHENKKSILQLQHQATHPMWKCSGCGKSFPLPPQPMKQARLSR